MGCTQPVTHRVKLNSGIMIRRWLCAEHAETFNHEPADDRRNAVAVEIPNDFAYAAREAGADCAWNPDEDYEEMT